MTKIYSIIPARGGSKGVPKKNIALVMGYPLIAYSIAASKLSSRIERTIVSTDSDEIAKIARAYGAEVPFLRPAEFAQDCSADAEVFAHAAEWFKRNEGHMPDLMVQLRSTTPLRLPLEIDRAIDGLREHSQASGLRSAHQLAEPPHKMFQLDSEGYFQGFFPDDPRPEYYNLPRQMFPKAYHPNGYVDIIRTDLFRKTKSLYGEKILSFITPYAVEVDTPDDLDRLIFELNKKEHHIYRYLKDNFRAKG